MVPAAALMPEESFPPVNNPEMWLLYFLSYEGSLLVLEQLLELKKQLRRLAALPEGILPGKLHGTLMVMTKRTRFDFKLTRRIPMGYFFLLKFDFSNLFD